MPLIGPTDPRIVFLLAATTVSAMSVSAGPAVTLPVVQPYHDLATSDINPALAAVRAGMTTCVLGFVVASPADGRTPAWGAAGPANGRTFSNEVARLRDSLHHLAVSFGGAEHTDLAAIDQSPDRLASTYERVCSAYRFAAVDFDVEGVALLDRAGMARRAEAWKIWRARRTMPPATLTLPVLPSGLTPDVLTLLAIHRDAGALPDRLNLMVMNYGPANLPGPAATLDVWAVRALTNTVAQLRANGMEALVAGPAGVSRIGLTPMIGRNAVAGEIFQLDDARRLRVWAVENQLGLLSFWSLNRDRSCPTASTSLHVCSGVEQLPQEFPSIFTGPKPNR